MDGDLFFPDTNHAKPLLYFVNHPNPAPGRNSRETKKWCLCWCVFLVWRQCGNPEKELF